MPQLAFIVRICAKFLYFPDGVSLVCHPPPFVQLLASGKTAQHLKQTRPKVSKKEKISSSIWLVLPNHVTSSFSLFLFISAALCSFLSISYSYWIKILLSCLNRGRFNIPVTPLNLRVGVYVDLVRKPVGIKLWRMTQIESFTNSHSKGTHKSPSPPHTLSLTH